MKEPKITIGGQELTDGQAATVRIAVHAMLAKVRNGGATKEMLGDAATEYEASLLEIASMIVMGAHK